MRKKIVTVSMLAFILTGCNTLGENGSSGGFSSVMNDFLDFSTTKSGGYTAKSNDKFTSERSIVVNANVDTAAARLKRKYNFKSEQEVSQLNNGSGGGAYQEAMARNGKYVWSAQQGSSYKMGRDMSRDVSMQLEVVKDGANRSKVYAKFWHKSGTFNVDQSMNQIKAAAEGK